MEQAWDPEELEDADPDVLERKRQELQRELELQMKMEHKARKVSDEVRSIYCLLLTLYYRKKRNIRRTVVHPATQAQRQQIQVVAVMTRLLAVLHLLKLNIKRPKKLKINGLALLVQKVGSVSTKRTSLHPNLRPRTS